MLLLAYVTYHVAVVFRDFRYREEHTRATERSSAVHTNFVTEVSLSATSRKKRYPITGKRLTPSLTVILIANRGTLAMNSSNGGGGGGGW